MNPGKSDAREAHNEHTPCLPADCTKVMDGTGATTISTLSPDDDSPSICARVVKL